MQKCGIDVLEQIKTIARVMVDDAAVQFVLCRNASVRCCFVTENNSNRREKQRAAKMVCDHCEEKLSKLVVPDKWTEGARNTTGGKDGGRKIGGNKLLKKRSERCVPCK